MSAESMETREEAQARAEDNRKEWVRFRGMWQTAVARAEAAEARLKLADRLAEAVERFNETLGTDPVAVDYARDDVDAALAAYREAVGARATRI